MAKKSKKSTLSLFIIMAALVFGVLTVILPMVTNFASSFFSYTVAGKLLEGTIATYKGTDVFFGTKTDSGDQLLIGSTLGLIGFILSIAGSLSLLLGAVLACLKKGKLAKLLSLIGGLCLLVAGIFMFVAPNNFVSSNLDEILASGSKYAKEAISGKMEAGAILGGIFGIVGGLGGFAGAIVK
ncbi:MAG TPA: hypothetical protein DEF61_05330 [Firmicutes bacterium]|nr:hypothetical protein [Bacillota bacterium]HBX25646.1 hypothetical protein [Bacillota bacterium]